MKIPCAELSHNPMDFWGDDVTVWMPGCSKWLYELCSVFWVDSQW